jgi:hypothetical protein
MISYVKIYGPPLLDALKALQKVAVDMPEVCIMDISIGAALGVEGSPGVGTDKMLFDSNQGIMEFFGVMDIPEERCNTIISKSGQSLGNYDFYFEWFTKPTMAQVEDLIGRIDKVLKPLGVKYTLTTK